MVRFPLESSVAEYMPEAKGLPNSQRKVLLDPPDVNSIWAAQTDSPASNSAEKTAL